MIYLVKKRWIKRDKVNSQRAIINVINHILKITRYADKESGLTITLSRRRVCFISDSINLYSVIPNPTLIRISSNTLGNSFLAIPTSNTRLAL